MIKLWLLAAGFVLCVAIIVALRSRRGRRAGGYGAEPVSSEWLAQARSREEHGW